MNELIKKVVSKIDKTKVDFIYLIGSYSRNAHNEFSDIDIIVALKEGIDSYRDNQYVDGTYVSINYDSFNEMKKNYLDPLKYIKGNIGIVYMVPLYDEESKLQAFKKRCIEVDYFHDFKDKINEYVNNAVVDWIEEVNKGCSSYFYHHPTKMLIALHGLTDGMLDVLAVSEGIITDKLGFLESFKRYFNGNSTYNLLERAYGIAETTLINRLVDGLMLYTDIIAIIEYRFTEKTRYNVDLTMKNILKVFKEVTK